MAKNHFLIKQIYIFAYSKLLRNSEKVTLYEINKYIVLPQNTIYEYSNGRSVRSVPKDKE